MQELSLNILDIVENSTKAKADLIFIKIEETEELLTIIISDNGTGISREDLSLISDPFYTTRTTRSVGMGIPFFRLAAEQTGGNLIISSVHINEDPKKHGTSVRAVFNKNHIDFTPLGDITSTLVTIIQGHANIDFVFNHSFDNRSVTLDTREMRLVLDDISLDNFEILCWIKKNLAEQYNEFNKK